ncbi:MAG: hypothetical protein AMXMBFR84_07470 [Candidatus Hydrogenedentota bacterium]
MRHHRIIWLSTGCIVVLAAIVVALREVRAPAVEPRQDPFGDITRELSDAQVDVLFRTMRECLSRDPQGVRTRTRLIVEAVADIAEKGHRESADAYYALALRKVAAKDLRGAEDAYRKAIELRPDWSWAHNGLGILLHTMSRSKEAEAEFLKAIEFDPKWSRPYNDLAILYRLTGNLEAADAAAQKALALEPDSVATHNNYGNLLMALERYDEAEAAYRKAIDIDPDHPAPYYNLACVAAARENREEVVPLLMVAITFDESYRQQAQVDADFDSMREDPLFQKLMNEQD